MPYGMSDYEYRQEIERKLKTGAKFTDEAAARQFAPDLFEKYGRGSSTSSSSYWDRYGGLDAYITSQRERYKTADEDLRRRLEADAKRVGYSLIDEPTRVETTPRSSGTTKTSITRTSSVEDRLGDLINSLTTGYSFPYEQLLRDLMSQAPKYQPKDEEDLLKLAEAYAALQVDSLLSELDQLLSSAESRAATAQEKIKAQYAGLDEWLQDALREAHDLAVRDAISRGAGRSGVVNWERSKLEEPIMRKFAEAKAEEAAALSAIIEELNTTKGNISKQRKDLLERKAKLTADRLAQLQDRERQLAQLASSGQWQMAYALAQLANSSNQFQQQLAASMLPWLTLDPASLVSLFGEMY